LVIQIREEVPLTRRRTRLSLALAEEPFQARATPVDVFNLARQWWFDGRRLNLGALADEVGVSRATVFRWVGNKDLLLAEILWSMYAQTLDYATSGAEGKGIDFLVDTYRRFGEMVVNFEPLRRFLRQDPEYALRVLTTDATHYHDRIVAAWKSLFDEQVALGSIKPQIDTDRLASLVIRINEGCVYSDMIGGRAPAIEEGCLALRLLLTSR
jgi:AcrR family transcriptional regulator